MPIIAVRDRMKEVLHEKDMTIVDLASRVHRNRGLISHVVGGRFQPSRDLAWRIADALGLDARTLFGEWGMDYDRPAA